MKLQPFLLPLLLLLLLFRHAHSSPILDSYYPPRPPPMMPLSQIVSNLTTALCGGDFNADCITALRLHIELPPIVYYPPPSYLEISQCIGWEERCSWPTIEDYLNSTSDDTQSYVLTGLNVTLPTASQVFLGPMDSILPLTNYLVSLNLTCSSPTPVFAPHVIEQVVALSTATSSNSTSEWGAQDTSLQRLLIHGCALTGELPQALTRLTALTSLDLSGNHLSGVLPEGWGAGSLQMVNLSHNALSGPLPSSSSWVRLGSCGAVLDLSQNDIHGSLPDSWFDSTCSTQGKDSTGLSTNLSALLAGAGPYTPAAACASPSSPVCNINGIAFDAPTAADPLAQIAVVLPGSQGGTNGSSSWVLASPFPFSVLLYGNAQLQRPGPRGGGGRFMLAMQNGTWFSIGDNACTASAYSTVLLVAVWLASLVGGGTLSLLLVLHLRRRSGKVAPLPSPEQPLLPLPLPLPHRLRHLYLVSWYLAYTAAAAAATAGLAGQSRREYCLYRMPCLPAVYLGPLLLLVLPMGPAALLVLALAQLSEHPPQQQQQEREGEEDPGGKCGRQQAVQESAEGLPEEEERGGRPSLAVGLSAVASPAGPVAEPAAADGPVPPGFNSRWRRRLAASPGRGGAWRWTAPVLRHLCPGPGDAPLLAAAAALLAAAGTAGVPLLLTLGALSLLQRWAAAGWQLLRSSSGPATPAAAAAAATRALRHRLLWLHLEAIFTTLYCLSGLTAAPALAVLLTYLLVMDRVWGSGAQAWQPGVLFCLVMAVASWAAVATEGLLGWEVWRGVVVGYRGKLRALRARSQSLGMGCVGQADGQQQQQQAPPEPLQEPQQQPPLEPLQERQQQEAQAGARSVPALDS